MKSYIKHILDNNLDEVIEKSYWNCHLKGLHSLMLCDAPGKVVRMFAAMPECRLDRNSIGDIQGENPFQSIAFHPHHCDLTLIPVKGSFRNWIIKISKSGDSLITEWQYESAITKGEMSFRKIGDVKYDVVKYGSYSDTSLDFGVFMKADEIHTVSKYAGEFAAWIVMEGAEDPNYQNKCYSVVNPNEVDKSQLYQKMTAERIGIIRKYLEI